MGRSKYDLAPVGSVYGKWKVLGYSHYDNEHYWAVKCEGCDGDFTRRAGQLVKKRSSGCQSCNAFEREKYSFWEGKEGMSSQYITKLKHRKKEVSITLDDLLMVWKQQKGICCYSGQLLTLVQKDSGWAKSSASIDRIDSSGGYVKGNVQWVHKRINTMKNDMTEIEFINWCVKVAEIHGGSCGV